MKKYLKYGFAVLLSTSMLVCSSNYLNAQQTAKTKQKNKKELGNKFEKHSPHKATIYSMALPGLGQAYNKKYWKIPIIYGGFGVMVYFINENKNQYNLFKNAYNYAMSDDPDKVPPNEYAERYSAIQLKTARDIYRQNLDMSYIITGLWYILNIIDATVDAHLLEFEVSEDLSLKIQPDIKFLPNDSKTYKGVKISFKFPITKN